MWRQSKKVELTHSPTMKASLHIFAACKHITYEHTFRWKVCDACDPKHKYSSSQRDQRAFGNIYIYSVVCMSVFDLFDWLATCWSIREPPGGNYFGCCRVVETSSSCTTSLWDSWRECTRKVDFVVARRHFGEDSRGEGRKMRFKRKKIKWICTIHLSYHGQIIILYMYSFNFRLHDCFMHFQPHLYHVINSCDDYLISLALNTVIIDKKNSI